VEVLNQLHVTAFGNHQLPNLRFQQPLQIGVRLQLPAWQPNQPIASLRLAWEQPGKTTRHALVEELTLPVMEAAELAAMDPDSVVAEALALLQASIDRQRVIDALDADDLSSADQTLLAIANQLAALPSSAAIQCERQAIAQQRSLLRENRSRKHLRAMRCASAPTCGTRSRSRQTTETTNNRSTFSFSHGHHFTRKPTA
jgi:Ca-activated chloride channel family protein